MPAVRARPGLRRWLPGVLPPLVVAVAVTLTAAAGLDAGTFEGFRLSATDALFPSEVADPSVVIVEVDAEALQEVGLAWPWPRDVQAELVRRLGAADIRLLVLDLVYAAETDEDDALASALREVGDVVVATAPKLRHDPANELLVAVGGRTPVGAIASAADAVGHAAIVADQIDGVVRSVPLVVDDDRRLLPSLALAALMRLQSDPGPVLIRPGGVQVGGELVPTGDAALLEVNYSSGLASPVSAAAVLREELEIDVLRGKTVFVGLAEPSLGDHHFVPTDKARGVPGVAVHAQVLNTMLTGSYLRRVGDRQVLGWVFGLALVVAGLVTWGRLSVAVLGMLLTNAGYVLLVTIRFDQGWVLDLVYPTATAATAFVAALGLRAALLARQRRGMAVVLQQYVPAPVARNLLSRGSRAGLPGGTVTFLFTDVVGSTELWDRHAREMRDAMRRHDELIEAAVESQAGALVRPRGEGDSRFAVFLHPVDGVRAALAIQHAFGREHWTEPVPISVRIGLHTGDAELRDADYYGSDVNRAARIRGLAGTGQVLASAATVALISEGLRGSVTLIDLGEHALKGLETAERVYEIRTADPDQPAT